MPEICIQLTDDEHAVIEREIAAFNAVRATIFDEKGEPMPPQTVADYAQERLSNTLTAMVAEYRKTGGDAKLEETLTDMKAIPADKQDAALAEIAAVIEKHRKADVKEEAPIDVGEIELPIDALEPREQKGK